jgi:glycosyltransferase involved in cell wall biosynthesis
MRALPGSRHEAVLTRDLGLADVLLRLPKRLRPTLVYESHGFAPEVAAELPRLLGRGRPLTASKRRRLYARERRVWQRADGYIAITKGLADELASSFGPRRMLAVIPDGTRLPEAPGVDRAPNGRPPTVGYAGHLYPWKGVDVLLHALRHVPDVQAIVIGGHPSEPDLARTRELAASLGVASRVTFTGFLEPGQVAAALAAADALVLPNTATRISSAYTSPLKLFEYLAAAKPIVASDLPAMREVLRHEENALLVPPGDPEALAAGIRRALEDAPLAARIGQRARQDAAEFSWDKRAERIEKLMEKLVSG